jgi:ADP-glucose pyrophosphorylase
VVGTNMVMRAHLRAAGSGTLPTSKTTSWCPRGAEVSVSMVTRGARIEEGAQVHGSIIGPGCVVAKGEIVRDRVLARP